MPITRRKIINHLSWHAGDKFARLSISEEFTDKDDAAQTEEKVVAPRDVQANSPQVRAALRSLVNACKAELSAEEPPAQE